VGRLLSLAADLAGWLAIIALCVVLALILEGVR
jgi:hypothetical protein